MDKLFLCILDIKEEHWNQDKTKMFDLTPFKEGKLYKAITENEDGVDLVDEYNTIQTVKGPDLLKFRVYSPDKPIFLARMVGRWVGHHTSYRLVKASTLKEAKDKIIKAGFSEEDYKIDIYPTIP